MPDPTPTPTIETGVPAATVAVVFTDQVLRRFLFGVVIAMTAVVSGVAAAAFYTSFEAIRAFAARSGGSARVVAALAPAALVLTFEILMMIVRRAVAARVTRLSASVVMSASTPASERQPSTSAHADRALGPVGASGDALTAVGARSALTAPAAAPTRPGGERSASAARVSAARVSGRGRSAAAADARLAEVRRLYLDGVTVAEEIARRLQIPASTTRRLLSQVKRERPARPTASGGSERVPGPIGERRVGEHPPGGERPLPLDDERSPAPERDGQPTERALLALTQSPRQERSR